MFSKQPECSLTPTSPHLVPQADLTSAVFVQSLRCEAVSDDTNKSAL